MDDYNAYVTAVNKIYDYIAKLKAGWSSTDHFAYIDKVEELQSAVIGCANEYKKPAAAVPDEEEVETTEEEKEEKHTEPELQFPQPSEPALQQPAPQPTPVAPTATNPITPQQLQNGPVVLPSVGPAPNPRGADPIPITVPTVSLPQQSPVPKSTTLAKLDSGSIPTLDGGTQ